VTGRSKSLPINGSPGSACASIPSSADARSAAIATYGSTSAPGTRHSSRIDSGDSVSTRHDTIRLSSPHDRPLPENSPLVVRRYEFTVGA
jgi:hypothetical protein